VPSRRPQPRVTYDTLYWFFIHKLGRAESSLFEYGPEDLDGRWITVVDTGCGMFLRRPPLYRECVYRRAPLNSVKFGNTGMDGIHYSFLVLDGHWSEFSPVVMTNPCCLPRNVVVAADLTEFLRLGIRTGYFAIPYHLPDEEGDFTDPATVAPLESEEFAEWVEPDMAAALQRLARQFRLQPLEGTARRLAELQHQYQPLIQRPSERRLGGNWEEIRERAQARLRPGDAVIWEKKAGRGSYPVKARVLAVTATRVTIAAEDPDGTGAGIVTRHVEATSLRLQPRGPKGQGPHPSVPR
jgi:hypothetical protein